MKFPPWKPQESKRPPEIAFCQTLRSKRSVWKLYEKPVWGRMQGGSMSSHQEEWKAGEVAVLMLPSWLKWRWWLGIQNSIDVSTEFIWVWRKHMLLLNRDQHMYYIMTERLQLRFFGKNYEWIYTLHRSACAHPNLCLGFMSRWLQ